MRYFFLFLHTLLPFALFSTPLLVNVGYDCQGAYYARQFNLRDHAYPFDWVIAGSLDAVTKTIKDDFKNWLNVFYLTYNKEQIINSYYEIRFVHDFPVIGNHEVDQEANITTLGILEPQFTKYLPRIREKYQRRIQRLGAILRSKSPVIFIRTYTTPSCARAFVEMVKKTYPQLPFTLVVVNPSSTTEENWDIEGVKLFYAIDKHASWAWWGDKTWEMVFKEIGVLE